MNTNPGLFVPVLSFLVVKSTRKLILYFSIFYSREFQRHSFVYVSYDVLDENSFSVTKCKSPTMTCVVQFNNPKIATITFYCVHRSFRVSIRVARGHRHSL